MPNALRCATPMEDWRTYKFIVEQSGGWLGIKDSFAAGLPWLYQVVDSVGALMETTAELDEGVLCYHAEKIIVVKQNDATIHAFLPGTRVYFDPTTRLVTPHWHSGYLWIGIATEPALWSDPTVEIDLNGNHVEEEGVL